jgi:hypothetical protein
VIRGLRAEMMADEQVRVYVERVDVLYVCVHCFVCVCSLFCMCTWVQR